MLNLDPDCSNKNFWHQIQRFTTETVVLQPHNNVPKIISYPYIMDISTIFYCSTYTIDIFLDTYLTIYIHCIK